MDKMTLNGFEVFEDFMPGVKTDKQTEEPLNDIITEGASEALTDEELEAIKGKKDEKKDDTEEPVKEDKKPKKEDKQEKEEESVEEDIEDIDQDEPDNNAVTAFFDVMSEKMGWSLGEEDKKPETPEELIEYFADVIKENSTPQYASEEVEKLDAFVKNGGDIKQYFSIDAELDLENIDIEDNIDNQKAVIKEFLKEKGFNSKRIEKTIAKFEDAGLLEDEAEDALEDLRDIKAKKKQQLLEDQEKSARELEKRQQDYFNSVVEEIKRMDNIRGIKIPEKDKRTLLEYIFKQDSDGRTKYQKDYVKSVRNLLESAYFTMKGDTLLKAAKTEGSNNAINKFKDSLNRSGISKKTKRQDNTEDNSSMWDSFARSLRA